MSTSISSTSSSDATTAVAWHEGLITKAADGTESLADPALWLDKAPAPLGDFIRRNMTAARAKTDGMLRVPNAEAPPAEWDPVWKALGRPDTPDGYGLTKPERMPDGVEWDETFAKSFASFAHRAGMPKSHADQLIAWHTEQMGAQAAAMRAAGQQLIDDERRQLSEAFGPRLAEAAGRAQQAAVKAGLPATMFDPAAAEFLGAPALKFAAALTTELAKHTREGSFSGTTGSPGTTGGYEYALGASTDKSHPDYEKYHQGDPDIVRRVNDGWRQSPRAGR